MKHAKNLRGVYFWDSGNTVISGSPAYSVNQSVSTVDMETPTTCTGTLNNGVRSKV